MGVFQNGSFFVSLLYVNKQHHKLKNSKVKTVFDSIPYETTNVCICCGKQMQRAISLPAFPITELYEDVILPFSDKGYVDQELLHCEACNHSSLAKKLDVEFIYNNYLTTSSGSLGAIQCLDNMYEFIAANIDIGQFSSVIDIGGNDGYFLRKFQNAERLVNIDPNAVSSEDIETYDQFFENMDLKPLVGSGGNLIVSSHTFEHVLNPSYLFREVAQSMSSEDIFCLQIPSVEGLVKDGNFVQLCHQHFNLFSLQSLQNSFLNVGMHILNYEYDYEHFGTLRVLAKKGYAIGADTHHSMKLSCDDILSSFNSFQESLKLVNDVLMSRERVIGFGAGLMVPVLKYFLPAVSSLEKIYDQNMFKQGKRFINVDVPIRPFDADEAQEADILITAVSTKLATRKIFQILADKSVRNIFVPTTIL